MTDKDRILKMSEVVSDWVSEMAMKDDGAIFWKKTDPDSFAPITYRDLDKLLQMDLDARGIDDDDRQRKDSRA